ncbi:DegV family EDD domain-containing protein [Mycoplasmatota bacterium]|nr:DegV family EDD domain-containing protein [Mycoplasmatota bacterium]
MDYITGKDLYQMFNYGTNFVIQKRKLLNDINVFPVPDGDTGNNLVHTMQTISRESKVSDSFIETLESISDSALIGARGNSGIIFAQFVNGLRKSSVNKDQVSIEEFTQMALDSVSHVYGSLSNPVEGTMLSVIKDWADGLKHILSKVKNVQDYFKHAFAKAELSLEKTKEQLAVLKKNNVVDSGAMGFVLFLQGINSYFNNEEIEQIDFEELDLNVNHDFEEDITYRYCTEGLVEYKHLLEKVDINEDLIKETLRPYGDSLVVVMGSHMFRIHIHTNTPELVFKELKAFGLIVSQKVDDMIQDIAFKKSKKDTVIVTDSIADINPSYLKEHDVATIPLNIQVDSVTYYDKLTINNEILFDMIEAGLEYPTTSTPTIKYVNDLFSKLLLHYKNIIVILVAQELSATFRAVNTEAEKLIEKGKNIYVIDSYNNSVSQGLLVKKAVEMLEAGKKPEVIVEKIEEMKKKTEILVCLETFKYATMSGRLPKAVGKIGMFFKIRPIMTLGDKGKGSAFGFALSQKSITKKIVKYVKKDMEKNEIDSYALIHCLNPDLLKEYEEIFTDLIGKKPEYISEVSSATAIHSGKGSVAIGYIRK